MSWLSLAVCFFSTRFRVYPLMPNIPSKPQDFLGHFGMGILKCIPFASSISECRETVLDSHLVLIFYLKYTWLGNIES